MRESNFMKSILFKQKAILSVLAVLSIAVYLCAAEPGATDPPAPPAGNPTESDPDVNSESQENIDIEIDLLDPVVEGIYTGLDRSTLRVKLNGTQIANSSMTITETTAMLDGTRVIKSMKIKYLNRNTSNTSSLIEGTNNITVAIKDNAENEADSNISTSEKVIEYTFTYPIPE